MGAVVKLQFAPRWGAVLTMGPSGVQARAAAELTAFWGGDGLDTPGRCLSLADALTQKANELRRLAADLQVIGEDAS